MNNCLSCSCSGCNRCLQIRNNRNRCGCNLQYQRSRNNSNSGISEFMNQLGNKMEYLGSAINSGSFGDIGALGNQIGNWTSNFVNNLTGSNNFSHNQENNYNHESSNESNTTHNNNFESNRFNTSNNREDNKQNSNYVNLNKKNSSIIDENNDTEFSKNIKKSIDQQLKIEGNKFYNKGEYQKAIECYMEAIVN